MLINSLWTFQKQSVCHFKIIKKIILNIKINGISILQVENIKLLGLTIDNKLEWTQHFTLLFNKLLINQLMLSLNEKMLNTHTK